MAEIRTELGRIVMSEDLLAAIAGYAASENYGIVGMSAKKAMDPFIELIKKDNHRRGIEVTAVSESEIDVDLYVKLEYGVSLPAVAQNTRDNVRYRLKEMTGLSVRNVNIHVEGIRVQRES